MLKLKGKWVTFKLIEQKPKTKVYSVIANEGQYELGRINWWTAWRIYCFVPTEGSVYETVCLSEIAKFLDALTEEQRIAKEKHNA